MKLEPFIFPALEAGRGEVLNLRVTRGQGDALRRAAGRLQVFGRSGGVPSVASLIRAIGEGAVLLERRGTEGEQREPQVHRGCPVD